MTEHSPQFLRSLRSVLGSHLALIVVIAGLGLVTALNSEVFLTEQNLLNLGRQVAVVGVIGASLTLLMISGAFDFSLGANAAVSGGVAAQIIANGHSIALAVMAGLGTGLLIGLSNGLLVAVFRAPSFVATLGTATLLGSVVLLVTDGQVISLEDRFDWLGLGEILTVPVPIVCMLGVSIVIALLLRFSVLGRRAYAVGGNPEASRLAGIPVTTTRLTFFGLAGLLGGFAGLMTISRVGAASSDSGLSIELAAVAAVVVGGTALRGGSGSVFGTLLGVLLIGLVSNSLNLLNVSSYWQDFVVGAVIIVAVVLTQVRDLSRDAIKSIGARRAVPSDDVSTAEERPGSSPEAMEAMEAMESMMSSEGG